MKLKNTLALALLGSSLTFGTMTYAADNSAEIAKLEREIAALDKTIDAKKQQVETYLPYEAAFKTVSLTNDGFVKNENDNWIFNQTIKNNGSITFYGYETYFKVTSTEKPNYKSEGKPHCLGSGDTCKMVTGQSDSIPTNLYNSGLGKVSLGSLLVDAKILRMIYTLPNGSTDSVTENGAKKANDIRESIATDEARKAAKVARIGELKAQ